jgi:hypothetical protein
LTRLFADMATKPTAWCAIFEHDVVLPDGRTDRGGKPAHWRRVALLVAKRTGRAVGLDTATRVAGCDRLLLWGRPRAAFFVRTLKLSSNNGPSPPPDPHPPAIPAGHKYRSTSAIAKIDPTVAAGRVFKRTGDGVLVELPRQGHRRDHIRCAGRTERGAATPR